MSFENQGGFSLESPDSKRAPKQYENLSTGPSKKLFTYSSAVKTGSSLPRPDFSTIEKKERTLEFKEPGSYKKTKLIFPESPLKSDKKKLITPNVNISYFRSNLFNSISEMQTTCRKLNFGDAPEKVSEEPTKSLGKNFLHSLNVEEDEHSEEENDINLYKRNFEKEFIILKTISQTGKYNELFKCVEISTKKILSVKKSKRKAQIQPIYKFLSVLQAEKASPLKSLVVPVNDFWLETDSSTFKQCLHIVSPFYEKGDLLDYLSHIELTKASLLEDHSFYWDLIFDMLIGVKYLHDVLHYIHFNIQPTNFLISTDGRTLLSGFTLARPSNDNFDDIIEGDSAYLAPEMFNNKKLISNKVDVFSLGLTILEIVSKVELPENGEMWRDIRTNMSKIADELKGKINNDKICNLISMMTTVDVSKRPSIDEIFHCGAFPELERRYEKISKGEMATKDEEKFLSIDDVDKHFVELNVKRSSSCKFQS